MINHQWSLGGLGGPIHQGSIHQMGSGIINAGGLGGGGIGGGGLGAGLQGMGVDNGMMGDPRGGLSHMGDPNAQALGLDSGGMDGLNGLGMILQGDMMVQGDLALGMGSMQQQQQQQEQQPNGNAHFLYDTIEHSFPQAHFLILFLVNTHVSYVHMCIHTYIHTYTHTHSHTHTHSLSLSLSRTHTHSFSPTHILSTGQSYHSSSSSSGAGYPPAPHNR